MAVRAHPKAAREPASGRPELRLVETRRRRARLHLFTYIVGNAAFWALWGAVSVSTDGWFWWPFIPFSCWTVVLAVHLRHAYRIGAQS